MENTLYSVDPTLLRKSSPFWDGLFVISSPDDIIPNSEENLAIKTPHNNPEGHFKETPIVIPSVSSQEFEHLLDYFSIL